MTEQEAKELIKYINEEYFYYDKEGEFDEINEALDMAISALEEIQQYRALGTVEELKVLKESTLSGLELANIWAALEQLKKYEAIGTLEELREAREKQVPKKPITYPNTNRADCPVCGATVRGISKPFGNFCSKCGRAIDWE